MAASRDASTPIILLGVGRSGTNLLAHVLGAEPAFVNLFESRYVWTYRARTRAHDVRSAEEATPRVSDFIRGYFYRHARASRAVPIDKTPSNVFRLPFVEAVFPEAKVIHLVREARDNVASRRHQWHGGRAIGRTAWSNGSTRGMLAGQRLAHLRTLLGRGGIPVSRRPAAFADNLAPFLGHMLTGRPRRYGERLPGMGEILRCYGVLEASAIQWREGIMHGITYGRRLPSGRYLELRYEDLIREPAAVWDRLAGFLDIAADGPGRRALEAAADPARIGRAREALSAAELAALEPHVRPTLEYLGYVW